MSSPRPLTQQELQDWTRWTGREVAWTSNDVARLLATLSIERETSETRLLSARYRGALWAQMVELRREILRLPLGLDFSEADLESEATDLHLAYVRGETLLGTILLRPREAAEAQMRQVAVRGDLQGRGIGSRMVEECELAAKALGFRRIVLHARERAIAFYERLGYVAVGDPFEEVGIPHQAMAKDLPEWGGKL